MCLFIITITFDKGGRAYMNPVVSKETKLDLVFIEPVRSREQRNEKYKLATLLE